MGTQIVTPTPTGSPGSASPWADSRIRLALLWVFATLNYLYCDLLGLMDPVVLRQYLDGNVNGLDITQGFLLAAAVLMELPMAMVIATVFLPQRASRWTNVAAGTVMTLVQSGSLFLAPPVSVYYAFFSAVEIGCTAFVVRFAWRWRTT